jgi:bacteriorhodopsin
MILWLLAFPAMVLHLNVTIDVSRARLATMLSVTKEVVRFVPVRYVWRLLLNSVYGITRLL